MPSFTVEEAYGLLRRIADREREAEHQAKQARQARDELIRVFDGQEGILRSGLGFDRCDVAVVTNVTSDHLGLKGINTLSELARVKAVHDPDDRLTNLYDKVVGRR